MTLEHKLDFTIARKSYSEVRAIVTFCSTNKLDFQSHIRDAILKVRRGIGIIKYLSKYISREVFDQVYMLYIRPHLDYGNIIYHTFDPNMHLEFTKKLEQVQYSAALAVTGAWRGTSRQRLYEELEWETLYHRRWYRRLCHFFSLNKFKSLECLVIEIPQERQLAYNLRNPSAYEQPRARTVRYSNTYFHNTLFEWSLLDKEIQNCTSIAQFKRSCFQSFDRSVTLHFEYLISQVLNLLTRLRLHFSDLNEHRFRHAVDCITPVCICGLANEDNEHFFMHCPQYQALRLNLFDQISDIPGIDLTYFDESSLCNLLLYRNPSCTEIHNSIIIESTITYIIATGRFNVR